MPSESAEDLTLLIGRCGPFQAFLTVVTLIPTSLAVWGNMFMSFGIYNPGWTCQDNVVNATNLSVTKLPENTIRNRNDTNIPNAIGWSLDCSLKSSCQNLVYNPESSTVVSYWGLSCDLAWAPSLVISIQMTGMLVGAFLSGQIIDRFGRKVSLYGQIALCCISHLVAVFSASWQMYASVFFFIGFSTGGILSTGFPYPLEFMTEWWRGVIAALPMWNVGFLTFASLMILLKDWRYFHITTSAASAVIFLPVFWTPESVRWLTVRGKLDQAKKVVSQIVRMNKHSQPDLSAIDEIANKEKAQMGDHNYTYLDLFRTPSIRSFSIKFGIIWFSLSVIYYTLSFGIRALSGDFYLNLLLFAVFEVPGMIFVAPSLNILGRRKSSLLFFGLEFIVAVVAVIVVLAGSESTGRTATLVFSLAFKLLIGVSWSIVSVFSNELYPTVIRGLHFGYLNVAATLGAILSPYLIPADSNHFYIIFLIIGALEAIILGMLWKLPESKGRALADIVVERSEEQPISHE